MSRKKKLLLIVLALVVLVALAWRPAQVQYHKFQRARYLSILTKSLGGGPDVYDEMLYHQQELIERGYMVEGVYVYTTDRGPGIMSLSPDLYTALKEEFGAAYAHWDTDFEGVHFWCRTRDEPAMQEFFATWESEHQDISFTEEVIGVMFVGWLESLELTPEKLEKIEAIALRDGEIDADEREILRRAFARDLEGELDPPLREKIVGMIGEEEAVLPEEDSPEENEAAPSEAEE